MTIEESFRPRQPKRLVVKLGSRVVARGDGTLDHSVFEWLADDVARLMKNGTQVAVVSSGAVAAGMGRLGLSQRPKLIPEIQAVAAVGQINLVWTYKEIFGKKDLTVGQILLTRDDLENRRRYQNAKSALEVLLNKGAVPIINENDTVVVDEIKFGDNDSLSAMTANLSEADCLVILSDVEGFYDKDPKVHSDARLLRTVAAVDETVESFVGKSKTAFGTGGMGSKLLAAKRAAHGGAAVVIASGHRPHALWNVLMENGPGTWFPPMEDRLTRRKHWIAYTLTPAGSLAVDQGAAQALMGKGKSLLPKGIKKVEGAFERGDCVEIFGPSGTVIARGLTNYSASEVREIAGLATWEIADKLGYEYSDEVVHRDDMVLLIP